MIVAKDIAFGEGPRWHDGTLWWADMHGHQVNRLVDGAVQKVCDVPNKPSGLGWLPDGRMLVVSMLDKRVLRQERDGSMAVHADLSGLVPRRLNDMTVDTHGRAYVGNFGFELDGIEEQKATVLVRVDPDGAMKVVAEDLIFPNGAVITGDGRTLIIAETFAGHLTAFDIDSNGDLSNRRLWAQLPGQAVPDGICLDAEGAVWVASPFTKDCLRIAEGGKLLQRIDTGRGAYACMLGGGDRRTLYICTADSHDPDRQAAERNGAIEAFEVAVPGAGLP
jgi:sugar lactone lactonase YvrE